MKFFDFLRHALGLQPERSIKQIAQDGEAINAAHRRAANHNARVSYRRNTRGLPVGIGPHALRTAKQIKNRISNDPEAVIGDTRLHAAETVLEAVRSNAALRSDYPRKSKLARRMAAYR